MNLDDLLAAWRTNNSVNRELLALCSDADLDLKPGKGKTIRSAFVHVIGNRRAHVEEKLRSQPEAVPRLDWQTATREEIEEGLSRTDGPIENLFVLYDGATEKGRWTAPLFLAYCIAHEAHHRSQIELALRLNGREPPIGPLYELWNWPKKARAQRGPEST